MSLDLLTPNLARTMPRVAHAFFWLLILDGAMLLMVHAVAFHLVRRAAKLTVEEARLWVSSGRYRVYRDCHKTLRSARRALFIAFISLVAILIIAPASGRSSPELTEMIYGVAGVGVLLPLSVELSLLAGGIGRLTQRIDDLSTATTVSHMG